MLLIIIFLSILAFSILHQWRSRPQLPKGPQPLPIIGNVHQILYSMWITGNIVDGLNKISKKYENCVTLWIFFFPMVFIYDFDMAHETHIKRSNIFGTRFISGSLDYNRNGKGIFGSNGTFWQDHRRFALTTLRNFGLGRNLMEIKILEELEYRIEDFAQDSPKKNEIHLNAANFFDLLVGSIINQLLTSKRFEKNDALFQKLKKNLASAVENQTFFDVFCPLFIQNSPFFRWRHKKTLRPLDEIYETCVGWVSERVRRIENGDHEIVDGGNDFLDAFLLKMEKDQMDGILDSTFTHETLAIDIYDLWLAGQETTSTTLIWTILCLLNHPECQEKARSEILKVTSGSRSLSQADRSATPYLNAVINEGQRIASILNINLMRKLGEDTFIGDQPLKSGTVFTTQLSMIHTNEKLFKDSTKFNPERYLETEGLEKKLIPFGIGKRSCLGESLARAELYLIIGNLLLDFNIEPNGPVPEIRTTTPFGWLKRSPNYDFKLVRVGQ